MVAKHGELTYAIKGLVPKSPTAWVEEMGFRPLRVFGTSWNEFHVVNPVICDDWQAGFTCRKLHGCPKGRSPQNFRSKQPFLLPRILAIKKRGKRLYQKVHVWFQLPKIGLVKVCFQSSWGQSFLKLNFFDWGACKLMKPCEKRNCCLAQNYFSYQAISECWYFMDPCHTCHTEFGWKAAALKGPGSSTRFDLHEKHVVGLYPPSGRMRMHCCGAFQTWRPVWFGAGLVWWDVLFQSWMTINVAFLWVRRSVETLNTLSTMLCLKTNI